MPLCGTSLNSLTESLSRAEILDLGSQLLKMLSVIHESGYVYNGLKFDNIFVGNQNYLYDFIDFGKATKYLDKKTKQHIKEHELECFEGNI